MSCFQVEEAGAGSGSTPNFANGDTQALTFSIEPSSAHEHVLTKFVHHGSLLKGGPYLHALLVGQSNTAVWPISTGSRRQCRRIDRIAQSNPVYNLANWIFEYIYFVSACTADATMPIMLSIGLDCIISIANDFTVRLFGLTDACQVNPATLITRRDPASPDFRSRTKPDRSTFS